MSSTSEKTDWDWDLFLRGIKNGRCTPFIGAGACYPILPLGKEIARKWAEEYSFPLEDSHDLIRVSQFLAMKKEAMFPKNELKDIIDDKLKNIDSRYFKSADEIHGVLANLPFPIYITTNYDDLMERALKALTNPKEPKTEICKWNKPIKDIPSIFDKQQIFKPSVANPVVFHLHGYIDVPESMVLTEDDYLDFLVNMNKEPDLIPAPIQKALMGSSLLFLGYGMRDWNFRVLFRSLVSYIDKAVAYTHYAVQTAPNMAKENEEAIRYLTKYYEELKIRMYWGKCSEFAKELKANWGEL